MNKKSSLLKPILEDIKVSASPQKDGGETDPEMYTHVWMNSEGKLEFCSMLIGIPYGKALGGSDPKKIILIDDLGKRVGSTSRFDGTTYIVKKGTIKHLIDKYNSTGEFPDVMLVDGEFKVLDDMIEKLKIERPEAVLTKVKDDSTFVYETILSCGTKLVFNIPFESIIVEKTRYRVDAVDLMETYADINI